MKKVFLIGALFGLAFNSFAKPVDINHASAQEIAQNLHGIGLKKAEAIMAFCQQQVCHQPEDLLKVKGIGEKTLEKIRQDLVFEEKAKVSEH